MAKLLVVPKRCLIDELVYVKIEGLQPQQKITLRSSTTNDCNDLYECTALYKADIHGVCDLRQQESHGGAFKGLEPMGLFWGLQESKLNKRSHTRMVKKNVETPLKITIEMFNCWVSLNETRKLIPLLTGYVKKYYKSENVERIEIEEGKIRGVLFVPKQKGKLIGIIDLFGIAGGLFEFRASLLASRGFIVLALAIYGYKDLSELMPFIDLDYFEEGVNYLRKHPKCAAANVGVIGTSLGGTIALAMATYIPGVKSAVIVNGAVYSHLFEIKFRGFTLKPIETNFTNAVVRNDDMFDFKACTAYPTKPKNFHNGLVEFPKSDSSFLFFMSMDDGVLPADMFEKRVKVMLKRQSGGMGTYSICTYPGAGHLLELPYTPLCRGIYLKPLRGNAYYGGKVQPHAKAQIDSWKKTIEFFKNIDSVKSRL